MLKTSLTKCKASVNENKIKARMLNVVVVEVVAGLVIYELIEVLPCVSY